MHFRQQLFRPSIAELFSSVPKFLFGTEVTAALEHRLSVDSQTTVICNQPCPPPLFRIQPSGARLSLVWFPAHFASHTNRACEPNSFGSHCFVLTVGILALVKTLGNHLLNALFSDYPSHFLCQLFSFKFLLRKYKKYILNLIRGNKN